MQYIDFHTHIFPDKIAEKTISFLSEKGGIPAYANGTLQALQERLVKAQIKTAIALPVLTRPESYDSILRFVLQVNEGYKKGEHNVYSFGGMHPDCENVEEKCAQFRSLGIKGLKLHPEYQQTYIDDEKCIRILNAAAKENLIVVTHSGKDVGYPDSVHCTPKRVLNALGKVNGRVKLVLAHMGACDMFEDVYELLAGTDVYLDTSYVLQYMPKETFVKILDKHGTDKILFASDSPWQDIASLQARLYSFGLDEETMKKIFYKNAEELLNSAL